MQQHRETNKIHLAHILRAQIICNLHKTQYKYLHVMERETTIILCACLLFFPLLLPR